MQRTKNASRNIIFGTILKLYQIAVPFFIRTVINYILGIEYLGLTSLFTSILQVLNLAELGVGSAMVYSMYKPVEQKDTQTICALMKLYRRYYRIIGMVVLTAGVILLPFLPKLISGAVPQNINIYILYLLNLCTTVVSYWMFAYKSSLLVAHQRNDIISKVALGTNTFQYIIQLIVLILLKSYYIYLIIALAVQIITNIITAVAANKMYPQYKAKGDLHKTEVQGINQRIRDLFTAKIGGIITNSADTIVVSAFLGLEILAVYQNYYYIISAVMNFTGIIFVSCQAGIGNSIVSESIQKNYNDLKKFTMLISCVITIAVSCLLNLFQPFMKIWMGEKNMLDFRCVILFCIYFYVCELTRIWTTYKDAAGIWHKDRFRPFISSMTNLVLNLILVQSIGIYGILLSTIVSYAVIGMPWLIMNMFRYIFKRDFKEYLLDICYFFLMTIMACICSFIGVKYISGDSFGFLIVKLAICLVVSGIIIVIFCYRKKEFKELLKTAKGLLTK